MPCKHPNFVHELSGKIIVARSCYNTANVFIYGELKANKRIVEFFEDLDVWRGGGYIRDGGKFFEVPLWVLEHIDDVPLLRGVEIEVVK